MIRRRVAIGALVWALFATLCSPVMAQQDPALGTAVSELLESYLKQGPEKAELGDGSALANWAILKGVGLPELQRQPGLSKGSWEAAWAPLTQVLEQSGFGELRPIPALSLWYQTKRSPDRFVRILGRNGLLDPKEPKERKKGEALREAIGKARLSLPNYRCSMRFKVAGWQYTGTASLNPAEELVRLALRGSQPCKITGSARTVNLNLKGRLFEDLDSPTGVKVQVLDHQFTANGCELRIKDRIDSVERLSGGGEAKIAAGLNLRVRDDTVSGRFQLDLVSKQAGVALLTGRAIYTLKGRVNEDGSLEVQLVPVSTSGSRVLRQQLEKTGTLRGVLSNSKGSGLLELPVLKDSLEWSGTAAPANRRRAR